MARLNIEKQNKLEPKRMAVAQDAVLQLGFDITYEDKSKFQFYFKGELITYFPYSGWHTGKSLKDGRGLQNLLKQLK